MWGFDTDQRSEDLSRLIDQTIEAENARLTKWLERIRDEAAEIRIVEMAKQALRGTDSQRTIKGPAVETVARP